MARKNHPPPKDAIAVELQASAVDMVALGIAKANRKGEITYANHELLRMAGLEDWRGYGIDDLFQGKDLDIVRAGLNSRFEQRAGSQYNVKLRLPNGGQVPISITAFPDMAPSGRVIGTLAIVRDLTMETAQRQMYQLVQEETTSGAMLHAIGEKLGSLVPFDRFEIIRLNEERTHLRSIFTWSPIAPEQDLGIRWWRIPNGVKPMLKSRKMLVIDDLREWYDVPSRRPMAKDPAVVAFLKEGFVSCLSYPITQHGVRVASVGLYRKGFTPFTEREQMTVSSLPIAEAVSLALRNENESNLNFLIELMKHIASAYQTVSAVAQTIVDKIYDHYGWDYVSIFQVHEQRGLIKLIAQRARKKQLLDVKGSTLKVSEGVIGYVYRTKMSVNISDVARSREFKDIVVRRSNIRTASELCVPIGSEAKWLLNVEDEHKSAFAKQEKRALEAIAGELNALLERSVEYRYRSAIFNRANDAILLTNDAGTIVEVNDAAVSLLRLSKESFPGRQITEFIKDSNIASSITKEPSFANTEVAMLRNPVRQIAISTRNDETDLMTRSGLATETQSVEPCEEVPVLLSAAALPDDIGGRVFVASDMTLLNRVAQLELAHDLYREVAAQVKTPMSLAIAWLRRDIQQQNEKPDGVGTKILQQLQKVELTLDRMMLYEHGDSDDVHNEVQIDVNSLVESVLHEMPVAERKCIATNLDGEGATVRGDPYALRYCLQTTLSYLLRLLPEDEKVELAIKRKDVSVDLLVRGHVDREADKDDYVAAARFGQVMTEIALGETTLRRLIQRSHGEFDRRMAGHGNRVEFRINLPLESTEPAS